MKVEQILAKLEGEDIEAGIEQARETLATGDPDPEETEQLVYGLGAAHFQLENYEQACKWLTKSNSDRAPFLLGFTQRGLDDHLAAAEAFERAAEVQPEKENHARFLRAQSLWQHGNHEQAQDLFEQLIQKTDDRSFLAEVRLDFALRLRNQDQADRGHDILQELYSDYLDTTSGQWAGLFLTRWHQSQGRTEQALDVAQTTLEETDDPDLITQLDPMISELQEIKSHQESDLGNYEY